ncbi:dihydrolipoamide dehydrogenase [Pseudoduganella flava]|uniref:Dihydrolipoamide dehydrogenase n=1 Tax=Pseudoduganella flava TaxID=871742 RepID=A0A562PG32_9BURK|nr:dihydrolipoyl dehydrogenase [Pseudoduganella flava]QGZ40224.1 dihydrolipoyl dehydrogenase [Pseudoduganella flava]TWI43404.1 dihydrolipoamide dehydrogenase [Pseudoduganella flava]
MEQIRCDVAIIGAGSAGLSAYRAARAAGKHAVMIEGGPYGTTCARVGCMPSKLLISAAEAAHAVHAASGFGVHAGTVRIDGEAVMERVRRERDRFVGFVVENVEQLPPEDKIRGYARFAAPNRLLVDDHTEVHAERIVIATGSTPIVPEEWALAGPRVIHSDAVFEWTDLPDSVAVIGTGVIGLELGQALHRLGVRVALYARGTSVAQLGDPEVLADAARTLQEELDIRFETQIVSVTADGQQLVLTTRDAAGNERQDRYDHVLVAIGRAPNVQALRLDLAGIERDRRGVPLYDRTTMQCGTSPIFIAGDANDELPLLPEAADQGKIAGHNAALYPDVQPGLRRTLLAIAFTEPQIATLGAGWRALWQSHGGRFAVGSVSFANQGRSRVMLQNRGLLRVYGEYGSGRFLGAEMIGPRAEHLGHLLAWAVQAKLTVAAMLDMPFYHPVIEEGVRTALRDLAERLKHPPAEPPPPCPDCTPGT